MASSSPTPTQIPAPNLSRQQKREKVKAEAARSKQLVVLPRIRRSQAYREQMSDQDELEESGGDFVDIRNQYKSRARRERRNEFQAKREENTERIARLDLKAQAAKNAARRIRSKRAKLKKMAAASKDVIEQLDLPYRVPDFKAMVVAGNPKHATQEMRRAINQDRRPELSIFNAIWNDPTLMKEAKRKAPLVYAMFLNHSREQQAAIVAAQQKIKKRRRGEVMPSTENFQYKKPTELRKQWIFTTLSGKTLLRFSDPTETPYEVGLSLYPHGGFFALQEGKVCTKRPLAELNREIPIRYYLRIPGGVKKENDRFNHTFPSPACSSSSSSIPVGKGKGKAKSVSPNRRKEKKSNPGKIVVDQLSQELERLQGEADGKREAAAECEERDAPKKDEPVSDPSTLETNKMFGQVVCLTERDLYWEAKPTDWNRVDEPWDRNHGINPDIFPREFAREQWFRQLPVIAAVIVLFLLCLRRDSDDLWPGATVLMLLFIVWRHGIFEYKMLYAARTTDFSDEFVRGRMPGRPQVLAHAPSTEEDITCTVIYVYTLCRRIRLFCWTIDGTFVMRNVLERVTSISLVAQTMLMDSRLSHASFAKCCNLMELVSCIEYNRASLKARNFDAGLLLAAIRLSELFKSRDLVKRSPFIAGSLSGQQ